MKLYYLPLISRMDLDLEKLKNQKNFVKGHKWDIYGIIWDWRYFNTLILKGELPQIKRECRGDATECAMTISGEESNYRLLLECMEIYGCLFECKIEVIFKHYTDEIERSRTACKRYRRSICKDY